MNEQLDLNLEATPPAPLPEILTLREFVAQCEREYGDLRTRPALRAALEESQAP